MKTEATIIVAFLIFLLFICIRALYAADAVPYDQWCRNVARYIDQSEPPQEHPRRNKRMHERLTALATIVQQLQMDADANSHPITVRHDCVQVAGHAYMLGEVYAATWEPGR